MSLPNRAEGPRRAARREEIRRRVLRAVEDQLRDGVRYSEIPLQRLAGEAGLSRSRFYVYFEDKGDLLRALTEDVIEELFNATLPWWSLPATAGEDDLRRVTERVFEIFVPHRELLAAAVQEAAHDSVTREVFSSGLADAMARYGATLAEAQREGRADPTLDPDRTTALLSWMTECGLYQLVARSGGEDTEQLLAALTGIVWNTLYAGVR
jgi:AcrR family transcriptional regulator